MKVGPYIIRYRKRSCASPKEGMTQDWSEYQIIKDKKIVWRCDSLSQALGWAHDAEYAMRNVR